MEEVSQSIGKVTKHRWTAVEDAKLVECLLELIAVTTWKGDNGFRPGYAKQLEKWLHEKLPGCGLKAQPHIESRVKHMKKQYGAIAEMLGPKGSGFGWNDKDKMVVVEKDVFKEWVKSHPNAAGLYNQPFPYLHDLSLVFGKDRANGEHAEDPADAVARMDLEIMLEDNQDPLDTQDPPTEDLNLDSQVPNTPTNATPSSMSSENVGVGDNVQGNTRRNRKRARSTENVMDQLVCTLDRLGNLYEGTKDNILELAACFKHEKEVAERRMKVYDGLKQVEGLTNVERLRAGVIITKDNNLTDYFFTVEPELRKDFVHQLLT